MWLTVCLYIERRNNAKCVVAWRAAVIAMRRHGMALHSAAESIASGGIIGIGA